MLTDYHAITASQGTRDFRVTDIAADSSRDPC